jgi:hypothetical protein
VGRALILRSRIERAYAPGRDQWNSVAAAHGGMNTDGVRLADLGVSPQEVLRHPRHEAAQKSLPELIRQLRQCANVQEGCDLQQELLGQVLAVETDRNAFSHAVKRMRAGKPPQAGAPEPQSALDRALVETWQLEHDVCERVARQYRCVGDALAWRVFGFQRKQIIALCQNAPPGVMAGKKGVAAELALVGQARAAGQFAILHDLTNCLRIGDVTVFGDDGSFETIEVKSDPRRRSPAQRGRIRAAEDAVRSGGPLAGKDFRARLYDLDIPFQTHLDVLRIGTERAAAEGIFAAKLPGDRALLVTDLYGCNAQGWTDDESAGRVDRRFTAALRRAGIGPDRARNIHATSLDSVSRDPLRVPLAAYPLHPVACARLIGDLAAFYVETSGPALADSLRHAGIQAQWIRPPGGDELKPGEVLMEMTTKASAPVPDAIAERLLHRRDLRMELSRTLQMRRSELDRYLIETIEQHTWIEGIRYMLADYKLEGRPWPHYRDEDTVWA